MQDSFYTVEDTNKLTTYKRFEKTYKEVGINLIDSEDKLQWLLQKLDSLHCYALDTETTGLDYHTCELVGIGFAWGLGLKESAYIPVGHNEGEQLDRDLVLLVMEELLYREDNKKILHNAKFDINVFRKYGVIVRGLHFDTIVAHYLLDTNHYSQVYGTTSYHKLDIVIADYYPIFPPTYKDVTPKKGTLAEVPIQDVAYYCSMDCWATYALYLKLKPRIENEGISYLFRAVEVPLIYVLADIEYRGLSMNDNWYKNKINDLVPRLETIRGLANLHKEGINLSSPAQLSKFIFGELKLPTDKVVKGKTGYSVNENTINLLTGKHPFIDILARYRQIINSYNTFVKGVYAQKHPLTNKLHPNFNQIITDTGRLSSSNPNAQNVPPEYREGIVPREGYKFISFDYSQCELRILAYLSQEPVLLKAFKNNEDVHVSVARILLGKQDISSEERRAVKTLNFGIIYGMQANKLAVSLGCTIAEANKQLDDYWAKLPRVKLWLEKIYRQAIGNGYTTTIMNRRRYYTFLMPLLKSYRGTDYTLLPNVDSLLRGYPIWREDAETLRSAGNAPIQGSNADITKLAMVQCNKHLVDFDCSIVLTIHDEIIFECILNQIDIVIPRINNIMGNAYDLGIPLKTDYHIGDNWKECKD